MRAGPQRKARSVTSHVILQLLGMIVNVRVVEAKTLE